MRFHKLLVLFLVVSLSLSLAFSQTALSVRKSASRGNETPYQIRLEAEAEAADARTKEAEIRAGTAKTSLAELERFGDKSDRKVFSQKQLQLKAEIARAELEAAQARAESVRSRAEAIRDKANAAAKIAANPVQDKKAQSKHYEAIWLQELAGKVDKDIAKANEEVVRKNKIAVDATRRADAANQELWTADEKEAARQAKLAEEDARKARAREAALSPAARTALEINAAAEQAKNEATQEEKRRLEQLLRETQTNEAAVNAEVANEAARKAKAEQEAAAHIAQETSATEKAKAEREALQRAKAEQEALQKAQTKEAELKAQAAKEAERLAKAEQEATRRAQEIAALEKQKAELEALQQAKARQEALEKALAKEAALKEEAAKEAAREAARKAKAEQEAAQKALEFAAAEKAKAEREAANRAKIEQEALRKLQAKETTSTESAKEIERRAKAEEKAARKAQEMAAAEKAKADREAVERAKTELEALRKAQANEAALKAEEERQAERNAKAQQEAAEKAQKIAAAEKAKAEREVAQQARLEQEAALRKDAALKAAATEEAARMAKAREEAARKLQAEAAKQTDAKPAESKVTREILYDGELFQLVKDLPEDQAKKVIAEKQAEAKAEKLAEEKARAEREAKAKAKSEEFFREKKVAVATPTPAVVPAIPVVESDSNSDTLTEALRKKQMELDAQENFAPAKTFETEPSNVSAPVAFRVQPVEPIAIATEPPQKAKSEDFFREKKVVAVTPAPAVTPATFVTSGDSAEDRLTEVLRQKQAELDAQGNLAPAKPTIQSEPQRIKVAEIRQPEPIKVEQTPSSARPVPVIAKADAAPAVSSAKSDPADPDSLIEILRKKQVELDAQESSGIKPERMVRPAPVQPQVAAPVPAHAPKPAPTTPAPRVETVRPAPVQPTVSQPKPVVSQPAVDPQSQDRLVEILRQKQAELDAREGVTTQRTPAIQAAKPVETKLIATDEAAARDREESEKRIRQIEAEIKAKEEAIKKSLATKPTAPVEPRVAPVPRSSESAKKDAAVNAAPAQLAPAVSGTKAARLAELLQRYKADQITPHEYHLQRAKIIAEP